MIEFRNAWPDEIERADRIVPGRRGTDRCFLAVETEPVERLIGAAFWCDDVDPRQIAAGDETRAMAEFVWRMLPRHIGTEAERRFLAALRQEIGDHAHARTLKTRAVLRADSDAMPALVAAGFKRHATNVIFSGSLSDARARHERLHRTFGQIDASTLDAISPDASHGPAISRLVALREGLLPPAEIERALREPASEALAFDTAWSSVLVETGSGRVLGAHLVKCQNGILIAVAMAIDPASPHLPGLGWFVLLGRFIRLCDSRRWTHDFYCRVNPDTNPAMFKLAALFGYREIERQYSYIIELSPAAAPKSATDASDSPAVS